MNYNYRKAGVKVGDHVGHRWRKDSRGIYCASCQPHVRLYGFGSPSNSLKRQRAIADSLDRLRELVTIQDSGLFAVAVADELERFPVKQP